MAIMYKQATAAEAIANIDKAYFIFKIQEDDTIGELTQRCIEGHVITLFEPEPVKGSEKKVTKQQKPKEIISRIDHGRIVALYTANPPRSIEWIAEDLGCSTKTVINHLVKEGLYKPVKRSGGPDNG